MTTVQRMIGLMPNRPGGGMGIEERVQSRFTLRLWSSLWIERGSWEGHFSDAVRQWTPLDQSASFHDTFVAAVGQCDPEDVEGLSEAQRGELYRIKYSHCPPEDSSEGTPLQRLEVLLQGRVAQGSEEGHWLQDPAALKKISLLKGDGGPDCAMSPSLLNTLFGSLEGEQKLKELLEYVQSDAALQDLALGSLWSAAYVDEEQLREIRALSEQQAKERLMALSGATAKEIAALAVGQRRLIFGGTRGRALQLKFESAADTFRAQMLNCLLKDPQKLARELTEKVVHEMGPLQEASRECFTEERCEQLRSALQGGMAQFLFPMLSQSLFKDRSLGAKILLAPIELLRFGTFQGLSLACEVMTHDFTTYLSLCFNTEEMRELYRAMVEGRLQTLLEGKLQTHFETALFQTREIFLKSVAQCMEMLPSYASDLIQLMDMGDCGEAEQPIWFEVERQENRRFSLLVFAGDAAAERFHSSKQEEGRTTHASLLKYCDLHPARLDAEFFHALYSYKVVPEEGKSNSYGLSHLYEGLLHSLGSSPVDLSNEPHVYAQGSSRRVGHWGVMRAHLRYHLKFKTDLEEEVFCFRLRLRALLAAWHAAERDLKLFASMSASLWRHSQLLIEHALSLFARKGLSLDELKSIYATAWEVSSATKSVSAPLQAKPKVLPKAVAHHLQGLFSSISPDLVEMVQDLLIGAVGSQAEEAIAAMREELPPLQPAPSPTWTQRAKLCAATLFSVVLGVSISDFYSPYYASYLRIALLVARIALTFFYPSMGITLNGAFLAAFFVNYALSDLSQVLFSGIVRSVVRAKYRLIGDLFARVLLGKEELSHFQALIHYWGSAFLRTGAVVYELPSTHSPMHKQEFSLASSEIPSALLWVEHVGELLAPKRERIGVDTVASCLQRWLNEVEGRDRSDEVSLYLNAQMRQLPVPLAEGGDFWSEVDQVDVILEAMASLAFALCMSTVFSNHCPEERKAQTKIQLYKAYAIIDTLARRCPESKLDGFPANGWALADWDKEVFFRVYDRDLLQQLSALQRYFGIGPKPMSSAEIQEKGGRSLFFPFRRNLLAHGPARLESEALEGYLMQFLDDPAIIDKLALFGVLPNAFYADKLHVLHANPPLDFVKDSSRTRILPRPFHLLRFANLLANHFMRHETRTHEWNGFVQGPDDGLVVVTNRDNHIREVLHLATFQTLFHKQKGSLLDYIPHALYADVEVKGTESAWRPLLARDLGSSWTSEARVAECKLNTTRSIHLWEAATNLLHHPMPRTQYEIIREVPSFEEPRHEPQGKVARAVRALLPLGWFASRMQWKSALSEMPPSERCAIEMIHTFSQEEQPLRALAYFEQKIAELDTPEVLLLLRATLLQSHALVSYLERYPQFAKTMGAFFTRALHYYQGDAVTTLGLIEVAIYARADALSIVPEAAPFFPDVRAILLKKKSTPRARQLLALPWLFVDPETASPQQIEEAIFDLSLGRQAGPDLAHCDLYYTCDDLFWKWRATMQAALDGDRALRDRVLHALAVERRFFGQQQTSHWKGRFPTYTSAGIVISFLKKDQLVDQVDERVRHEIAHQLHAIFGDSIPSVNPLRYGVYDIPSQKMEVELRQNPARLVFCKIHKEKKFYWMRASQSGDPSLTYWVDQPATTLLVLKQGQLKEMRGARSIPSEPEVFKIYPERFVFDGEACEEIDLSVEQHGLGPLTWFSSAIRAYRSVADRQYVRRIEFTAFGIAFNVVNGKAMGEGPLSGLFISSKQVQEERYPTLRQHTRYLLLENRSGARQVVLPSDTLYSAATSWILKHTMQLQTSHLIDAAIDANAQQIAEKTSSRYYLYDIDEKGYLVSSDPTAMLHLFCYHLAQDSFLEVECDLRILESLGRRKPFPGDLHSICREIALAAFGMGSPVFSSIGLRLCAISEENRLLQRECTENHKERFLSLIAMQGNYYSHCIRDRQTIDERQELFILRGIVDRSHKIFLDSDREKLDGGLIIKFGAETASEMLLVHRQVMDRYELLQKKYGLEQKKTAASMKTMFRSLLDGSDSSMPMPGIPLLGISNRRSSSAVSWISSMMRKKNSASKFDLDLLSQADFTASWETVPLSAAQITHGDWTKHMHIYYLLARGIPPEGEKRRTLFQRQRNKFLRMLDLLAGRSFGDAIDAWIATLQLASFGFAFPQAQLLTAYAAALQVAPQLPVETQPLREEGARLHAKLRRAIFAASITHYLPSMMAQAANNWGAQVVETGALSYASSLIAPTRALLPLAATVYRGYRIYSKTQETLRQVLQRAGTFYRPALQEGSLPQEMSDFLTSEDAPLAVVAVSLLEKHCTRDDRALPPQQKVAPFEVQDSPIIQYYFARLNQSLDDFYARPSQEKVLYRPQNLDHFHQLGADLRSGKEALRQWLEGFEDELISFAKRKQVDASLSDSDAIADLVREMRQSQSHFDRDRYLRELIWAFGREDRAWLSLHTELRPGQVAEFEKRIARYLIHATRLHQLERAERIWQEASLNPEQAEIYLGQLSFELTRKRAYTFDGPSARLVRANLLFEYGTKTMLWTKQVQKLQEMLLGKDPRVVLELITGMGKSSYGIPITSFFGADRSRAVYNIFPDSLAEENTEQVSTRSALAFGQAASAVAIDRGKAFDEQTLWALLFAYRSMVHRGEQFNGRKKDLQALELCFIEAANGYWKMRAWLNLSKDKETEKQLFYFMQILSTLRKHVAANVDEAHRGFRRNEELNHPLGLKKCVQQNFVRAIMACALELTQDPTIAGRIQLLSGRPEIVDPKIYHEQIKPRLAEKMSHRFAVSGKDRYLFVQYLCGASAEVPPFVLQHPKRGEIGLVVGVLNKIMPDALQRRIFVDYGPSKQGNGEYARPYSGNDSPVEQSTIKNPHEAILKTCIQFLHTRLHQAQVKKFIKFLQQEAKAERKTAPAGMTKIESSFAAWCQHRYALFDWTSATSEETWSQLTALLNLSDAAVLAYAQHCVIPDVTYFTDNLKSDSHNFASMFSSFYSGTASPNRDGTFPLGTQVLWDRGTAGEFVDFTCKTCDHPDALCEIERSAPLECLREILAKQFGVGLSASALIDTGALLAGLSNKTVVREMLTFIERERPDLQGVVFFDAQQRLVIWEKGSTRAIPLSQSSIPLEQRLTYFDQIHTFGADIPQPPGASGILTLGSATTLEEFSQGGGRMRGLKALQQRLIIAVQSASKQKVSPDRSLSIRDIITFVQRNEASLQGQENYLAACQKISNVIRRAVLDAMISASSVDEMLQYFEAFRTLLISKVEDDPFTLYGFPEMQIAPQKALEAFKKAQFAKLQSSFLSFPLDQIWKELEPIGHEENCYPEHVLVCRNQNKFSLAVQDLGMSQEVAQQQTQQQQVQQELQQDQDIEIHMQLPAAQGKLRLQPALWDPSIAYFANADWLKIAPIHQKADRWNVAFHAVVHSRPDFASHFRGRMWWTNNFLGVLQDGSTSAPFSRLQKPILELLIVRKYMPDGSVRTFTGAIDQHEAHAWRQRFAQDRARPVPQNHHLKIALYDLSLQTIIDTGKNGLGDEELHQDDAFLTDLVRWKFLAGHTALYRGLDQKRDQKLYQLGQEWLMRCGKDKM